MLGSGDGVVTNEGYEQEKAGAGKNYHGCTITELSVGFFCTRLK
jgi:hypothetical protein